MKLRITRRKIALAVVLAPVLYVLNVGPLAYGIKRGWVSYELVNGLYRPFIFLIDDTPLAEPYGRYIDWWEDFADPLES